MGGIAAGAMGLGIVISLKDHASRGIEALKTRIQGLKTTSNDMVKAFTAGAMQVLKGAGILATGAVILMKAFTGPISAAVKFESVMADVNKVANFTASEYKEMSAGLVGLSKDIPVAVEGLGEIMAAAAQAGIAKNELLDFTRDAAYMGVAFDIAAMEAGDAMAGLRSILGLTQEQVILLGDSINHLSNNMNARAPDLLNFSNRAGGIGRMAGMTGQQIAAFGAAFLDLKTPPEVAARSFSSFIMKLTTASSATKDAQGAFAKLGTTGEAIEQAFKKDATSAMFEFLKAVKSSSDPIGILRSIVGEGFADDLAKLAGGSDKLAQALNLIGGEANYAGSMLEEYAARANTTENAHALLADRMAAVSLRFGQTVERPYRLLVNAISSVVNAIADLPGPFYVVLSTFVAVTGVALVLIGGLISIGGIMKMWPLIWRYAAQSALTAITAMQNGAGALASTMRTAMLPMLKWAAIAGLVYLAWTNNFGGIRDVVKSIAEGFKMAMRASADGIVEMDEAIVNSLKKAGIWEYTVMMAKIFWRLRQMWKGFTEGFKDSFSGIKKIISGVADAFRPLFEAGKGLLNMLGILDGVGKSNISVWKSWGYAIGVIAPILGVTLTAIKAFAVAKTIFLAIKGAALLMNAAIAANPIGAALVIAIGLTYVILSQWDSIKSAMTNLWNWFSATFPGFVQIIETFVLAPIRAVLNGLEMVWGVMKKIFGGGGGAAGTEAGAPSPGEIRPAPERARGRGQSAEVLATSKNRVAASINENGAAAGGAMPTEIKNNVDVNVQPQEIKVYIDKRQIGKAVADYTAQENKRTGGGW